jgi:hypothetical protein
VNVYQASPTTDAVIAALETAGLLVGDGEKPVGGGWEDAPRESDFVPYVVVYSLLGGTTDGTIADPDDDAWPVFQLTSVGGTRGQAEWIGDVARSVMLSGSLVKVIGTRRCLRVLIDVLGGAQRDDSEQPAIFYVPERYRLSTTPA